MLLWQCQAGAAAGVGIGLDTMVNIFDKADTTHCSPLTTYYLLLTTHYTLFTTHYSLLTTHYSLLTTHHSLLTTHHLQLPPHPNPTQAIQLSSEEKGEEMSSMTRQAFINTALEYGLLLQVSHPREALPCRGFSLSSLYYACVLCYWLWVLLCIPCAWSGVLWRCVRKQCGGSWWWWCALLDPSQRRRKRLTQ